MKFIEDLLKPNVFAALFGVGLVCWGVGAYQRGEQEIDRRDFKERRAEKLAKIETRLGEPLKERLYETSMGELMVVAVPIKRGRSGMAEIPCFVLMGKDFHSNISCSPTLDASVFLD